MIVPETENSLVLRTDFSDGAAWETICTAMKEPDAIYGFQADVTCISDREFDGLTVEQLIPLTRGTNCTSIFIVDRVALTHPEWPILTVDLYSEPGRTFRVIPALMWAVQNNLFLANMDFCEFANVADPDGILRGFPED